MELLEARVDVDDVDAFLAAIQQRGDDHGAVVQAFDARYVAGRRHLQRAVELAGRARDRGERIARDQAVEILLYAAGRRQINQALEMGVSAGQSPVAIVIGDGDAAAAATAIGEWLRTNHTLAEVLDKGDPDRLCEFFEISDRERQATTASLEELVCERVALLVVDQ